MSGNAVQIEITCISTAEQFVVKLFDWMANHYHQKMATSVGDIDSSVAD